MNIAIQLSFLFTFMEFFLYPFSFNLCVLIWSKSLVDNMYMCIYIYMYVYIYIFFPLFINSAAWSLLIRVFGPFIFKVFIDRFVFVFPFVSNCFCLLLLDPLCFDGSLNLDFLCILCRLLVCDYHNVHIYIYNHTHTHTHTHISFYFFFFII